MLSLSANTWDLFPYLSISHIFIITFSEEQRPMFEVVFFWTSPEAHFSNLVFFFSFRRARNSFPSALLVSAFPFYIAHSCLKEMIVWTFLHSVQYRTIELMSCIESTASMGWGLSAFMYSHRSFFFFWWSSLFSCSVQFLLKMYLKKSVLKSIRFFIPACLCSLLFRIWNSV